MQNREMKEEHRAEDFSAIRISIASPEDILKWSHGEVTKPETINYRTLKPEKDGLFCERIFGPDKDWECYCGKYKKIRHKGVVCDKCGVEVTRSVVRRERMGHIELAVPVTHIWFLRGVPSSIGLVLGMSVRDLERVVYFISYIVTEVDEAAREEMKKSLDREFKDKKKKYTKEIEDEKELKEKLEHLDQSLKDARSELVAIQKYSVLSELKYREYSLKYGNVFKAQIGTEAILELLREIDLKKLEEELEAEVAEFTGQKKKKSLKRLKVIQGLLSANIRPEWMIVKNLPVIPPGLRPMVQLDGGRFATADLNDLYRRVINRNNRLKKLIAQDAPEVIIRNEKRMLQEAVDALIDNNARRDKAASGQNRRKLRSIADMLKGKQGRFRQNLLGKRVDYSGRSVIVAGPELKMEQCGLPKMMALELFKPFVISKLVGSGIAHNIKSASRMIERGHSEVWDALDEVIENKYVLLNRAPTLHRLGIQAFLPVLIEGKAIQLHPLVCEAYNADFDGDQMAVHVPLSRMAQAEAEQIMISRRNLLKPAAGEPVVNPRHEMTLGIYWMTQEEEGAKGEGKIFGTEEEAITFYNIGAVSLRAKVKIRVKGKVLDTTIGRVVFNQKLPEDMEFINEEISKKKTMEIIKKLYDNYGSEATSEFLDGIKDLGFKFATRSGLSFSMDDATVPVEKEKLLDEAEKKVIEIRNQFDEGFITEEEKYTLAVKIWEEAKEKIQATMEKSQDPNSFLTIAKDSGARGDIKQINQIAGMKGNVINAAGRIIELPIKSNYKEGLSALEFFISTHGTRKGFSDTALRTSDSGYLTRRLVDVAQEVTVTEKDCGTKDGLLVTREESVKIGEEYSQRLISRYTSEKIVDPKTGEVVVPRGTLINEEIYELIEKHEINEVVIRSILECDTHWGVCQKCYGADLASGEPVALGTAVGIIAAQSIGEPGTQLTMRTVNTGGIVGVDITQGLPRVQELFEARKPKGEAVLAEIDGIVKVEAEGKMKKISVISDLVETEDYDIKGFKPAVKNNAFVETRDIIAEREGKRPIRAKSTGIVKFRGDKMTLTKEAEMKEYLVSSQAKVLIPDGEKVTRGTQITEGSWNLQKALELCGEEAVQRYITLEIQRIYATQGQIIDDKHIEIIIRQMFSRARIEDPGDSKFITGDIVSRKNLLDENERVKKAKKKPAVYENLLLSISKVSHSSDSWLSAASFQETNRVLISASIEGRVDYLKGLKENVIIGKLIPVGTGYDPSIVTPAPLPEKEERIDTTEEEEDK
ncbi:MAG: DNA-directed RNA polymerase subunit beta' [Patescibacteria group bacterium]|nr:DNA-directed RNA polymerase subunit beta' [Patescibacteria group bacterium]